MQLYRALILFMILGTACGLRCYTCATLEPKSCTAISSCPSNFNRCFSMKVTGTNVVTKGCQTSMLCIGTIDCCEGDLCNSAIPTGPSVFLLLLSSAIIALFL